MDLDDQDLAECQGYQQMQRKLELLVRDGLQHGFFDLSVHGEVGKAQRRIITIKNGKSYKFTIHVVDLPR